MYDNNRGLVFVKYRTLTETINCLEGLQNIINILPQKDKIDRLADFQIQVKRFNDGSAQYIIFIQNTFNVSHNAK